MGGVNRAAYLMIVGMLFIGLPVVTGEVMLENIHGTTDQAGLQRVDARSQEENGQRKYAHPGGYDFEQICTETRGLGASTIFLVASAFKPVKSQKPNAWGFYQWIGDYHYWEGTNDKQFVDFKDVVDPDYPATKNQQWIMVGGWHIGEIEYSNGGEGRYRIVVEE